MERFIITDLTRFTHDKEHVCLAGLSADGRHCIRPMPYLSYIQYREMGIRPGVTLEAELRAQQHYTAPHIEDRQYQGIRVIRGFDARALHDALKSSTFTTLSEGFGTAVEFKCIPVNVEAPPNRSIITIAVEPRTFSLQLDNYDKLRARFRDNMGTWRSYIPISDIGITKYVESSPSKQAAINSLNQHINSQESLFLRVGIGRPWQPPNGINSYWFQINSAYSFPELHQSTNEY